MKKITTKTASQVVINFEIASLGHRTGAFAIDMLILFGVIFVLSLLFSFMGMNGDWLGYFIFFIFLFYTLAFEIATNGSTPGKKAMGLRVLKFSGAPASILDYVIRWVFRFIDLWMSLFVVASAFNVSSPYGQRLGDMMAGTTVIKFDKKESVSLKDILEMKSKADYIPKYPQVEMLTDAHLLLVKSTIFRYQKNNNEAHKEAMIELVAKLKSELDITDKVPDSMVFLKTLLKDYVVLTR